VKYSKWRLKKSFAHFKQIFEVDKMNPFCICPRGMAAGLDSGLSVRGMHLQRGGWAGFCRNQREGLAPLRARGTPGDWGSSAAAVVCRTHIAFQE